MTDYLDFPPVVLGLSQVDRINRVNTPSQENKTRNMHPEYFFKSSGVPQHDRFPIDFDLEILVQALLPFLEIREMCTAKALLLVDVVLNIRPMLNLLV